MKVCTIVSIVLFSAISLTLATSKVDDKRKCRFNNEVWNDCGPPGGGCVERVCGVTPPKGIACPLVCRPNCYCKRGYVRQSAKNRNCISIAECNRQQKRCGVNEVWKECGTPSSCEPTCARPKASVCPAICVQGCFCKPGYIRKYSKGPCICKRKCRGQCSG